MTHPNEQRLRELYALFARGDLGGFLGGCTDDVTFTVPGPNRFTGDRPRAIFSRATFGDLVGVVMEVSAGTFSEEIVDVFANEEHGVLLLVHRLTRNGRPVEYRTAHIVELREGRIATWREYPGDDNRFAEAWS
jgi:uncharacterized protein